MDIICLSNNQVSRVRVCLCQKKNVLDRNLLSSCILGANNTHRVYYHQYRNMNLRCYWKKTNKLYPASLIAILQSLGGVIMCCRLLLNKSFALVFESEKLESWVQIHNVDSLLSVVFLTGSYSILKEQGSVLKSGG